MSLKKKYLPGPESYRGFRETGPWRQAKGSCEYCNESLVVIKTDKEREFISKRLKDRTVVPNHEWHIGLHKNRSSENWTWINGKPLTQKIKSRLRSNF